MVSEKGMDEGFMIFWVRVVGTFLLMVSVLAALATFAYMFNMWGFVR